MNTLEDSLPTAEHGDAWPQQMARALEEQRQRARLFLAAQRERLEGLEEKLGDDLRRVSEQLAAEQAELSGREDHLQRREAALEARADQLAELKSELARRQEEWEDCRHANDFELHDIDSVRESLEDRRRELEELAAKLDERAAQVERQAMEAARIEHESQHREHELQSREREWQQRQEQILADERQLAVDRKTLDDERRRWEIRHDEITRQEAETSSQRRHIARQLRQQRSEQQEAHDRERAELGRVRQELDHDGRELERRNQELDQRRHELEREREDLGRRSDEFESEREAWQARRTEEAENFARQNQSERDQCIGELEAELETRATALDRIEAERARLEHELAESSEQHQSQMLAVQVALAQAREDNEELRRELSALRQQVKHWDERREAMLGEMDELRLQRDDAEARAAAAVPEYEIEYPAPRMAELQAENDRLCERLALAEQHAHDPEAEAAKRDELDKLRRRFEMAIEDLRESKQRVEELEDELAGLKERLGQKEPSRGADGRFDWETQKKLMLAELEANFDPDDDDDERERLSIENTIRITDQVVAEKDKQLAELRQQLESPAARRAGSDVAVGAQAVAAMLDQDELICQERENLKRIQNEWREKLRKAEVDISVERAQLARQRAELEEKFRQFEEQGKHEAAASSTADTSKKHKGGNWLARLGLKDE